MALERIGAPTSIARDPAAARAGSTGAAGEFSEAIGDAIQRVDALQLDADRQAAAVAGGAGNLHETALALEKADVALRVASKVRSKLVEAYQEIMRMPV